MIPSDRAAIVTLSGEQYWPVCTPQWSIHPRSEPLVTTLSAGSVREREGHSVHEGFVGQS